jgi:osmotically-inducible protein OsmY
MTPNRLLSTDEKLRAAVLARFAADERVTGENLHVGVSHGIVHLAGVVNSSSLRRVAEELASGSHGVRGVVNRIEAPDAPNPSRTIYLDLPGEKDSVDT